MTGIELERTEIVAFMVSGGILILFGLYLMLRPPGHGATRMEVLGLKFEASSAAILVFLVGTGLLLTPVWSVEAEVLAALSDSPPGSPPPDSDEPGGLPAEQGVEEPEVPGAEAGTEALVLPAEANVRESEPNDSVHRANQIPPGSTVRGRIPEGCNPDWYVVDTSAHAHRVIEIALRKVDGWGARAYIFGADEHPRGWFGSSDGVAKEAYEIGSDDRFFIRVECETTLASTAYDVFYAFRDVEF